MVNREIAIQEIDAWLDFKKVRSRKRVSYADNIDVLVDAVEDGLLVLHKETGKLNQTLQFPIKGTQGGKEVDVLKELEFVPRLNIQRLHSKLEGVKAGNGDGRILGYICALTGQPKDIINKMLTDDYEICQAIAIFFL